jgi:signal transduction histidine kinase
MIGEFYTYALYLFYGLAFFTLGVSITSRDTSFSNLKLARYLWLFALFAYTHAVHEWSELFLLAHPDFTSTLFPVINASKLALVFVSYFLLLRFGSEVLSLAVPGRRYLRLLPSLLCLFWVATVAWHGMEPTRHFFNFADLRMRNLIGFPAGLLAGLGCILYSRSILHISRKGAWNLVGAGSVLVIYGVLTGIIPSGTVLPVLPVRVELMRGLSAIAILHFFMNALHIFDIERKAIIEDSLQRFAKSEKLTSMGKLAAGIAHEINNPLTNVSINVEMLKTDLASALESEPVARRFGAIERNLDRASKIARELLYFSREGVAEFEPLSLNLVAQRTVNLLGARQKDYRICYDFAPVPEVEGIPWKLEEVFLNLLINAMEASPNGAVVTISTDQRGDEVVAAVTDTGGGIPTENLHNVLDPFFTTKEVGMGTGLGLSICYGIMELHGGRIEIESEPGRGTTVSLIFPQGRS